MLRSFITLAALGFALGAQAQTVKIAILGPMALQKYLLQHGIKVSLD